jgi:aspartyl-tRNA(Asn)/glutamyl-tRNA(Gln) amidotransferase subunit C
MTEQKISEAEVRHVAHLSRLKPSDEEVAQLAGQLSEILGYMAKLDEVDTTEVPPTAHALPVSNILRPDETQISLPLDTALANAPQREGSFFGLPKVLDQDSGA